MKALTSILVAGFLALIAVTLSQAQTVTKVLGGNVACDPTVQTCLHFPILPTTLCAPGAGCPRLSAPSLTDSNRFWGTVTGGLACRTSSNGGVTWGNCPVQPLSSGVQEQYAGASDGSTIALGANGVTCNIYRSIDNGTVWTLVFTNAGNIGCGGGIAGGSRLKCALNGFCTFAFDNTATGLPGALTSTDNGQNWTLFAAGVAALAPLSVAFNGSAGIAGPTGTLRPLKYLGAWSSGAAGWAGCLPSGSMEYNSSFYSLCKVNGVNTQYQMRTIEGALFKTFTLPGASTLTTGVLGFSPFTNFLYIVAGVAAPVGAVGMWLSLDDGNNFTQIFTSTNVSNASAGDIYLKNGCIYFSIGIAPVFAKVC